MSKSADRVTSWEREHSEVNAILAALNRSPLMARLFSYVCEKYFAGEGAELTQAKIAAEVFNRSETFDRTRDSIARVEIHRLRKKLKQYYQSEGKDHPVQIEILPGCYAPVFRYMQGDVDDTPENGSDAREKPCELETVTITPALDSGQNVALTTGRARARWLYLLLALPVLVLAYYGFQHQNRRTRAPSTPRAATPPPALAPDNDAIRLLCGYQGPTHIGRLGRVWSADRFFHGGGTWQTLPGFIRRASDPFLFRTMRTGDFSYDIPVRPGVYELHLYFVETNYGEEQGGGENSRTFAVLLNGATLLQNFDPICDADGPRIADERVFKDVQPARDGKVHIVFQSRRGQPMINAIELVPGIPHRQLPVRIATQLNSYTDHLGQVWSPDNYYLGGQMFDGKPPITNTADPMLYATERAGHFSYAIPVDSSGTYTANLYFAETYFGPGASGTGGVGSRVFNVMCNGVVLLDHFDMFREVGTAHALEKSFHHLKPTAQGKLNFTFEPVANYASVFGLEVLDETK